MGSEDAVHTGYFNDGIRRIDMVLVLADDGDLKTDEIKTSFLLNILKVGLEVEAENGVMKSHERYIFVKVHAPASVVQLYGDVFNIRKHFKDNHVEFVNAGNAYMRVLSTILPFLYNNREKEWIKIVRKQYPGPGNFSTLERSQIVYRILLVLPFGSNENYVGLERLIQNNIILDAYALHDGPYFFLPKQDIANKVNARQILYNNWMGADMIIKDQPLSLLQEYFGEKIAFYFAYSEFFNRAVTIAAAGGIYITNLAYKENVASWGLFKHRGVDQAFCNATNAKSMYMCPRCRDFDLCPFYDAYSACNEVFLNFLLETPNMAKYSLFIVAWGTIFVILWNRREYYLSWLWEHDMNGSNIVRPGYKINLKTIKRSKVTGILRSYQSIGSKIVLILEVIFILCLFLAVVFPMTIFWAHFQFKVLKVARNTDLPYPHFSGLVIFSVIYGMANTVLEKVIQKLSYLAISIENHKTQDNYEKSLIVKQFGASLVFNFSFFFFLAFIKGRLYTYPFDIDNWESLAGIAMMNCGFFTCTAELSTLLCVYVIFKLIVLKGIAALCRYKTDYNQCRSKNAKVPCWEREFRLNNVDEQFIMNEFNDLAMQFALCTLFVISFPLTPLLVLIANTLNTRYNSWHLLLGSRRPLLHNSVGMANWRNIIFMLAMLSALINVLMMVCNTRGAKADCYEVFGHAYGTTWVDYFGTSIPTADYEKSGKGPPGEAFKAYKGHKPTHCLCFVTKGNSWLLIVLVTGVTLTLSHYTQVRQCKIHKLYFWQHFVILLLTAIVLAIPMYPKDITETLAIEKRIVSQCLVRQQRRGLQ